MKHISRLLRKLRIIRQALTARDFSSAERFKSGGILDVFPGFETARMEKKIRCSAADVLFGVSFVLCLLLMGCAKSEAVSPIPSPPTEAVEVKGLYDAGSSLEISSLGALKVYPLSPRTGKGLLPFGDGILLFSGGERTTLTLFTKQTLVPTARRHLSFSLAPEDCASHGEQLSYYDPENRQTVVLDAKLEEVTVLTAPSGLIGKPVLSPDGSTL